MRLRFTLYIVTRRNVMSGEKVRGVYRDRDMAALHVSTVALWQNSTPGLRTMEGPWWWMFRGNKFLMARAREEYGYLDWSDE